jgi:hypothetical protein
MEQLRLHDFYFLVELIALGIFAVLLITWILDKSPVSPWLKASGGITVSFITVPAFLFGLAISTIAAGTWNKHENANLNLVNETVSLRTLISISSTLPAQEKEQLNTAINNYITTVLSKEWPAMKIKDISNYEAANAQFDSLCAAANSIALAPNQRASIENRLQSTIDSLRQQRMLRVELAKTAIDFVKWPSLYTLSFLLLFTVGMLQITSPRAMRISLTLGALCIGVSLLFIFINTSPFSGLDAVNPEPLSQTLKLIQLNSK